MYINVESTGPPVPLLSTNAAVKPWKPLMVSSTRLKKITGESMGRVTARKRRHAPAPSTAAASYSSVGTCLSPARKITMGAPNCQIASTISVSSAQSGSLTQGSPSTPNRARNELNAPSRLNMLTQTMASATLPPSSDGR